MNMATSSGHFCVYLRGDYTTVAIGLFETELSVVFLKN